MRCDCECEPHVHAGRVTLDRRVHELLDAAEVDDLGELTIDLASSHPQDRAVEVDVFATGQLGMETGADLEDASHAATDLRAATRRRGDPREDLEQR